MSGKGWEDGQHVETKQMESHEGGLGPRDEHLTESRVSLDTER